MKTAREMSPDRADRDKVARKLAQDSSLTRKFFAMILNEISERVRWLAGETLDLKGRIDVVMTSDDISELHYQSLCHPI